MSHRAMDSLFPVPSASVVLSQREGAFEVINFLNKKQYFLLLNKVNIFVAQNGLQWGFPYRTPTLFNISPQVQFRQWKIIHNSVVTGSVIFCLYPASDNALLLFPFSSVHEYKWHASASRLVLHANWCVALEGMAAGFCIRASLRCCDTWSTYKPGSQGQL